MLTHNYTGYPMVRQAREMVAKGQLGDIRVVQAEYPQDWLTEDARSDRPEAGGVAHRPEAVGRRAAPPATSARMPTISPASSPGLELAELSADLDAFVPGRLVDDNLNVLLRFKPVGKAPAAKGMIWASQVAPGHENGLKLRVYGTKGGLEWVQADPNYLWYTPFGQPKQLITRGGAGAGPAAARVTRVPPGHPEGYLEGFANIYQEAARAIRAARKKGGKPAKDVHLSDRAGRRRRRRLRRGLREVVEEERRLDEALGSLPARCGSALAAGPRLVAYQYRPRPTSRRRP